MKLPAILILSVASMVSFSSSVNAETTKTYSYSKGVDLVDSDGAVTSLELVKILKASGFKGVRARPYDRNRHRVRGISPEGHPFVADVNKRTGIVTWSSRASFKTI